MANDKNFEVTPTLKDGKVEWKMCRVDNGVQYDCGNSDGTYPNVTLDAGKPNYKFKITITNDLTGKDIKFAATNALVIKKGEPSGPGTEKQIGSTNGGGNKVLTFVDKNSLPNKDHPDDVVISYGLNFTDKNNNPVTAIDPDIKNGGTNTIIEPPGGGGGRGYSQAEYVTAAAIALIVGLVIGFFVHKLLVAGK